MIKQPLIPTPNYKEAAALFTAFDSLSAAIAAGETALQLYTDVKGELLEAKDYIPERSPSTCALSVFERNKEEMEIGSKTFKRKERRLAFLAAKSRVLLATEPLKAARAPLLEAISALRSEIDARGDVTDEDQLIELDAAECNIWFAERALLDAYVLKERLLKDVRWATNEILPGEDRLRPDLRQILRAEYNRLRREWVAMYGLQGGPYSFDGGGDMTVPAGPYKTRDEAAFDADSWISFADTVGGGACLYNVRTGKQS